MEGGEENENTKSQLIGTAPRTEQPRDQSSEPRTRHLERRVCQRYDRDLCADAESAPSRLIALALAMDMAMKHPTTSHHHPLPPFEPLIYFSLFFQGRSCAAFSLLATFPVTY
ncbi:uncharacterized protein LOC108114293 [Drosophila eugracilis]|uniref:uncharacterized protein LOC108114293 n=1 Tax=Drosophila eugracilis TaxID=29029 RepID=UPI0007E5CC51|nr:uncharacterized protein LOC108114293 [Drosophila eugracilis]